MRVAVTRTSLQPERRVAVTRTLLLIGKRECGCDKDFIADFDYLFKLSSVLS